MKILCVPQPWASAVVLGGVQAISMQYDIQYRGQVAIVGGTPKGLRIKQGELPGMDFADVRDSVLGVVDIIGSADVRDCCDLPYIKGPFAWTVTNQLVVSKQPYIMPADTRLTDIDDAVAAAILKRTMMLREWKHDQSVRFWMPDYVEDSPQEKTL